MDKDIVQKVARVEEGRKLVDLLAEHKLKGSKGEIRRLVQGGGLQINGEKVTSPELEGSFHRGLLLHDTMIIKLGKREFRILVFSS